MPGPLLRLRLPSCLSLFCAALEVKSMPPQEVLAKHFEGREDGLPGRLVWLNQVHGRRVLVVGDDADRVVGASADGVVVRTPGVAAAISVADCAPVAIADEAGEAFALIHAGWRGAEAGIVEAALESLEQAGVSPGRTVAYIGPAIAPSEYEVSPEFAEKFPNSTFALDGRTFMDLPGEIERRLRRGGVERIFRFPFSTYSTSWLHSFRRDGGCGRNRFIFWRVLREGR